MYIHKMLPTLCINLCYNEDIKCTCIIYDIIFDHLELKLEGNN